MPIKSYINDPLTNRSAAVLDGEEVNALAVATRDLKTYNPFLRYFLSDQFGQDMNIDASLGGTSDVVYSENAEWTTSAISGTWDFASTDQAHDGTLSVKAVSTENGDIAQFYKGSDMTVGDYVAISGWIYLEKWQTGKEINVYGWDTTSATQAGDSANIGDYVNTGVLNAWQKFAIPLQTMDLISGTIDAIRVQTAGVVDGDHPDFYLDEIQFEQTGDVAEFIITPRQGTWIHVSSIRVTMADEFSGTLPSAGDYPTMPAIPYDGLLGEPALIVGMVFQVIRGDRITFSLTLKQMSDFLELPGTHTVSTNSDGINTWLAMEVTLPHEVLLKYEDGDYMKMLLVEDLTGFLRLRSSAGGRVEHRATGSLVGH